MYSCTGRLLLARVIELVSIQHTESFSMIRACCIRIELRLTRAGTSPIAWNRPAQLETEFRSENQGQRKSSYESGTVHEKYL